MRDDSNTTPPSAVYRFMMAVGYVEIEIPMRSSWWKSASGDVGSWEEALDRSSQELIHLRQVAALSPKSFWRTREFWGMAVSMLGIMGPALGMMSGQLDWLPPDQREPIGAALLSAAGIATAMFARARMVQKAIATVEQSKALASGPSVGGG